MASKEISVIAGSAVAGDAVQGAPDPEVSPRPRRRRFSAEYKLEILKKAAACRGAGEIGALLRTEGLYSSHLSVWRREQEAGALKALGKKRGRKPRAKDPVLEENARLQREAAQLRRKLERAEMVIEIQKKVAALLGIPLSQPPSEGDV